MIRLDQFGWQFAGAARPTLSDVSLEIERGTLVAMAGPSGCGKTTLAMAMCGLLMGRTPGRAQGSILVDGQDVSLAPLHELSQTIGLVQQNPEANFATLRVCDEVAFGMENHCVPPAEMRDRVEEALELLHIAHLRDRDLATLSGGEKQRVAVAAVVAGRPKVLILDEPTASLDPDASRDLFAALAGLCRETGQTVVVIEHKLDQLLPLRPRMVCMEKGRIVMDTPAREALPQVPAWLGGDVGGARTGPEDGKRPETEPLVDVAGLTLSLDEKAILEDVSFRVCGGECVAVMGPNGGGKTTLLSALLGLIEPTAGQVRTCGLLAGPGVVSQLAKRAGFVFQNADHQLVGETVIADALYSARHFKLPLENRETLARRHLAAAGLGDRLGDHPFALSWGEKRRLNLISAVLQGPRVLLLDEPHAGQDWPNVERMQAWAAESLRLAVGETDGGAGARDCGACILVTHDPRVVARWCSRVLFFAEGRLLVDTPVEEAFERLRGMGYGVYAPSAAGLSAFGRNPSS